MVLAYIHATHTIFYARKPNSLTMSLKNRSVLITGGAGFIGSHLVDRLIREQPDNLIVVDNLFLGKKDNLDAAYREYPRLKFYKRDASDRSAMQDILEEENVDVVFNLAVVPLPASLECPAYAFRKNVAITLTLCELLNHNSLFNTLIHYSSSEAYGTCEYAPMDEDHPLNGTTPYAASKSASDMLVLSYYRTFGIDTAIVRPFNNYGPRQNEGSFCAVIPETMKRILKGDSPIIYGDGKQTRDYIYVTDTCEATIKVYENKSSRGKAINIASGEEVSIEYVISLISEYLGSSKKPVYEPERLGDVRRHIANTFLAKDLLGFTPQVKFEDGMKATVAWYRDLLAP